MDERAQIQREGARQNKLRLLPDEVLRALMLAWLHGEGTAEVCARYGLTRIQYQRQKYYYRRKVLADLRAQVFAMRDDGRNSVEIGVALGIPHETVNKIIARNLL